MSRQISKAQLKRDRRAITTVLKGHSRPVSMAQILLQAGEGLHPALCQLITMGTVIQIGNEFSLA